MMNAEWQGDFRIRVKTDGKTAVVSANRDGLLSLAAICKSLADEKPGAHVHLDPYNSLEDDSAELIIEIEA